MQILRKSEGQLTISLFVCILLWLIFCWQGITTAVEIWWGNDIFNHCFFVIPANSAYAANNKCTAKHRVKRAIKAQNNEASAVY